MADQRAGDDVNESIKRGVQQAANGETKYLGEFSRGGFRVAGRCIEHNDMAWLYDDGSVQCVNRLVVESSSENCTWGPMPPEWLSDEGQAL